MHARGIWLGRLNPHARPTLTLNLLSRPNPHTPNSSDLYFLLDNLLALNTAILVKGERLVADRRLIAHRYFSWETFQRGDRWCFPVFLMEFLPFYVGLLLQRFLDLPDWFLSICAVFRARRMFDLLSYFHALEVRLGGRLVGWSTDTGRSNSVSSLSYIPNHGHPTPPHPTPKNRCDWTPTSSCWP